MADPTSSAYLKSFPESIRAELARLDGEVWEVLRDLAGAEESTAREPTARPDSDVWQLLGRLARHDCEESGNGQAANVWLLVGALAAAHPGRSGRRRRSARPQSDVWQLMGKLARPQSDVWQLLARVARIRTPANGKPELDGWDNLARAAREIS